MPAPGGVDHARQVAGARPGVEFFQQHVVAARPWRATLAGRIVQVAEVDGRVGQAAWQAVTTSPSASGGPRLGVDGGARVMRCTQ
jgi:hypothetical protein